MKQLIRIIAESIEDVDYEDLDGSNENPEFTSDQICKTLMLPNSHVIVVTNNFSWGGDTTSYQIDKGTSIEDIEENELAKIIFNYIDHFQIKQETPTGDKHHPDILDYMVNSIDKNIEMIEDKIYYYGPEHAGYTAFQKSLASFAQLRSNLLGGGRESFIAFYSICKSALFEYEFSNFIQALEPK